MIAERLVITGAGGMVGAGIRPFFAPITSGVRLVDACAVSDPRLNEEIITGDLHDPWIRRQAFEGATAVVHLTGIHSNASHNEHRIHHVDLVESLIADASACGVRRIVLASTMHVLGMYKRSVPVAPISAPRPDSVYAEAKMEMEQRSARLAQRLRVELSSVRIGCFQRSRGLSEPCAWIGPEDLARLFHHLVYEIDEMPPVVHAVAPYWGDDCGQRALQRQTGFRYHQRGGIALKDRLMLSRWYPDKPEARKYRGGVFAWATLTGNQIP